ncbi:right-handed parallel beta-helix repeat-containing protein [Streptomyces sp. NPDC018957]
MSTSGSDQNDGSSSRPVKSLQRVKQILMTKSTDSATILIAPGTYYETAKATWGGVPQSTLLFRRNGDTGRPVFDGANFYPNVKSHYWMDTAGGPRLDVRELRVRNYRTGGIRMATSDNIVRNMIFENLGNKYVPHAEYDGYAALHLLGSSRNTISNVTFRNLDNTGGSCFGCIHAVYAADGSSDNQIDDSRFSYITGDPVRLRNASSNNVIELNSFADSARGGTDRAMVSFWQIDSGDVCGTGNKVNNNTWNGKFFDGTDGAPIMASGANPGLTRCTAAISGSGNDLVP